MVRLLMACALLLCGQPGWADPQSKSWSSWQLQQDQLQMSYSISAREVTRLPAYRDNPDLGQVLHSHLQQTVEVGRDDAACERLSSEVERARTGFVRVAMTWSCPAGGRGFDIHLGALFREASSHIHFARFHREDGDSFERLFTRRDLEHHIEAPGAAADAQASAALGPTLLTYILFGFEHILIGLDHIAFLLTLLLLARRLRDVIFIVTGFTLGHSITLSLTVLGFVTPQLMVVEALIGFTIALVAMENIAVRDGTQTRVALALASVLATLALVTGLAGLAPPVLTLLGLALFSACYLSLSSSVQQARQLRPAITTLFGLIHGFGFAGVLMEVGLPESAVVPALLGFNIGVEIGQVAIVTVLALLGRFIIRFTSSAPRLAWQDLLSAALCGLGSYWFIQRLYF